MNIPSVPAIEGFSDMMDLLHNSKLYSERLATIHAAGEEVNKRLERYKEFSDAEQLMSQATEQIAKAKDSKVEADKYVAEEMQKIVDYQTVTKAEADGILARATEKENFLAELENELQIKEAMLERLKAGTEVKLNEAAETFAQSWAAKDLAEETKRIYDNKIAKIQAISESKEN